MPCIVETERKVVMMPSNPEKSRPGYLFIEETDAAGKITASTSLIEPKETVVLTVFPNYVEATGSLLAPNEGSEIKDDPGLVNISASLLDPDEIVFADFTLYLPLQNTEERLPQEVEVYERLNQKLNVVNS